DEMSKDTILFDINETVLDLTTLSAEFKQVFGSEHALPLWFSELLHTSTVCISSGLQTNFAALAEAMLDNIAVRYAVVLSATKKAQLLANFAKLAAHADIKPALSRLRAAGFKTVAFSNSSTQLLTSQLENAGIIDYFDTVISVEQTGSFKPDPQVYKFAASTLEQPVTSLRLVAAHDWDTHGALSAGLKAAFIDRKGLPYHPLYRQVDIYATSMDAIVEQIIQQ
ncbi:haloacid dehalogenase type II, partial [Pseudoalteromonas sp.]|uniref:haloacid dehalogenase type II n=1 Tax=Pseudoalteromonas sp. TaxID=53249 RepID=UPI0035694E15